MEHCLDFIHREIRVKTMKNKELYFTYFLLTQAFNLNTCHAIVLRHYHFSIALLLFSKKEAKQNHCQNPMKNVSYFYAYTKSNQF